MTSKPDPILRALADEALISGTALLHEGGRHPVSVASEPLDPGTAPEPLLGVRCTASVIAVGYPAEVVVHDRGEVRDLVVGVAVGCDGRTAIADPTSPVRIEPAGDGCVTFDVGLRALRLPTPPPPDTVSGFVDRLWLDRVLDLVLLADLGNPPRWRDISRCHPLTGGRALQPSAMRRARDELAVEWEAFRRSVARSGGSGPVMSAALAAWYDTGSFARRLLSALPDPDLVADDLDELLRSSDAEQLHVALSPLRRAS